MSRLYPAGPAPLFICATPSTSRYTFGSVAGRYILLVFLPVDADRRDTALAELEQRRTLFDGENLASFLVVRDPGGLALAQPDAVGRRWFLDRDGEVSRLYGALGEDGSDHPLWVLLDPMLRVLSARRIENAEAAFAQIAALPAVEDHAGIELNAPVLVTPRIFEPALCRRLIDYYRQIGGAPSGVMREVDGRTIGVIDDFKRRSDVVIVDEGLRSEMRAAITHRLLPEIRKAMQFEATRLERYIVACYDAESGGYFRPHRDNTTSGTAHRKFAVSINLNAEEFEGGDLRFPEFGRRTYRPPTGGAVVFSCSLLHEATAVTKGRRYASLPFLFDEAGEQIRERNRHLLDGDTAAPAGAA